MKINNQESLHTIAEIAVALAAFGNLPNASFVVGQSENHTGTL